MENTEYFETLSSEELWEIIEQFILKRNYDIDWYLIGEGYYDFLAGLGLFIENNGGEVSYLQNLEGIYLFFNNEYWDIRGNLGDFDDSTDYEELDDIVSNTDEINIEEVFKIEKELQSYYRSV